MSAAEHQIGRVVFEIAASDRAAVDRFADTVRAHFDVVVERALQSALDRIDRPGVVTRFGRLDVDLGKFDMAALAADDIGRRIADSLAAMLHAAPLGDDADELAAFLQTGELPWSEPGRALAALIASVLALDSAGMMQLAARLRTVLIRRRAAERLARQLPAVFIRRLIRALLPEPLGAPLAVAFGPDRAVEAASAALVPDRLLSPAIETIHRLAREPDTVDLGDVLSLFAALDGRLLRDFIPPPMNAGRTAEREAVKPSAPIDKPAREGLETTEPDDDAQPMLLPIHAAGGVLLHPFLGTLFEKVGLLEAPDRFRDSAARARAVVLAHHLATGAEDAPEPETSLFKLLCGMTLSEPVPRRINLTAAERAETDALLGSVISHWPRLGNTSPAGLREGFLTRPGRLERQPAHWRLTVERRGIDVLLDGLPWTLSHVKTPFMRTLLLVDWR